MRLEQSFIQIPGIGRKTERTLWSNEFTDWRDDVDAAPIGPQKKAAIESFAADATAELAAGNVRYFGDCLPSAAHWRLADTFKTKVTAIDIETTGLDPNRAVVTTVSVHDARGSQTLVRDRDLTADRLASIFEEIDLLLSYNGAQFDLPFLHEHFATPIDIPHLDLRYPCRRVGLTGGLKAIEQELGISRDLPDVDGREAISLWHRAERGDDTALERLIRYNQEDTETLFPVLSAVTRMLNQQEFLPYIGSTSD